MLKDRVNAARPIAQKLDEVEKSLNLAMLQMGQLMSNIAAARMAPGTRFQLDAGIDASERINAATATTIRSYREIIEAHAHLAEDRDNAGLATRSLGDIFECPPSRAELAEVERSENSYRPLQAVK